MPPLPSQVQDRKEDSSESSTSSQSSVQQEMSQKNSRFSLTTQLMFLKKQKDPTTKRFDDDERIRSLAEAQEIIPEECITQDQSEVDPPKKPTHSDGGVSAKMSPTDFKRSVRVTSQLPTASLRQLGVGSWGGAETLAIFHQLIFDERTSGTPDTPLARIEVDEKKKSFGLSQWGAVRNSASSLLSKHAAVAGWNHCALSFVEQDGLPTNA